MPKELEEPPKVQRLSGVAVQTLRYGTSQIRRQILKTINLLMYSVMKRKLKLWEMSTFHISAICSLLLDTLTKS